MLRHALRLLGRSPGFAAAAILTLPIGIGASTAIFSVVRGVLLRPLEYGHAGRLVAVSASEALPTAMGSGSWPARPVGLRGDGAGDWLVALGATVVPARRAMRVQPMVALREE